jgi:hypothetical protein
MKVLRLDVCVIAAALALSACSGASGKGGSYGSGDPTLAAANPGGGPIDPFLSNGQAVLQALDAIAAHSGKPLRVTSISADQVNGLMVDVQEPAKHVNVDRYTIAPDGTLSGPTPVKLMSMSGGPITAADVDRRAFDPHVIAFARLTPTIRQAIAKRVIPTRASSTGSSAGLEPTTESSSTLSPRERDPSRWLRRNLPSSRCSINDELCRGDVFDG